MYRRPIILLVVLGGMLLLILLMLFILSRGQIVFLEFKDFPQNELKRLQLADTYFRELTFSGSLEVESYSPLTYWAMKLFPGHFLIKAQVGDRKVTLLVDTGASLVVLSPDVAVAAQASLARDGPEITHWNQSIPTYLGWVQELDINGLVAHNVPVLVLGKQPTLKILGLPVYRIDGFLGMSLMEKLAVTLDWRTGVVTFRREPARLQLAPSAPLRLMEQELHGFRMPYYVSDAFIDGAGPYMALIDTGASDPEILISGELLQALGWREERRLIRQLKLGEIELKDVWAVPARQKEATGGRLSGRVILISSGVFQAQGFERLTLDFLAGKLYAER